MTAALVKDRAFVNELFRGSLVNQHTLQARSFANCTFSQCQFNDSHFLKCKFYECKFIECELNNITVKGCTFFDVTFEECQLQHIFWPDALWPKSKTASTLKFYHCNISHSSFATLNLKELILVQSLAHGVDFQGADCAGAKFQQTDFSNSLFNKTNLFAADLSQAKNYDIDIFTNTIKFAKFSMPEAMKLLNRLELELEF